MSSRITRDDCVKITDNGNGTFTVVDCKGDSFILQGTIDNDTTCQIIHDCIISLPLNCVLTP